MRLSELEHIQAYADKLPSTFPRHLLLAGYWLGDTVGVHEVAWPYPAILDVIASLATEFYGISGGDVYRMEAGHLVLTYDNWSANYDSAWAWDHWLEYVQLSYEKSCDYINWYHNRFGEDFWYVPVFGASPPSGKGDLIRSD